MTFADWYASTVAPRLEKQLTLMPAETREPLRIATRSQMAECWNAALDAGSSYQQPATAEEIVTHLYLLRVKA